MLIKWENFYTFFSWRLRQENILTGDVLREFHCILFSSHTMKESHWVGVQEDNSQPLSDSELEGIFQTRCLVEQEEQTDTTPNFRMPALRYSNKRTRTNEDSHLQESLLRMKSFSETVSKLWLFCVQGAHW
jgi:hypothetical protein